MDSTTEAPHGGPPEPLMPRRPDIRHPGWWLLALVLYSGVIHFAYLGRFPFISHEARAAIRTEGLMNEGGWIVPQFYDEGSGEPMQDFQKPPLPFWIAGAFTPGFNVRGFRAAFLGSLLLTGLQFLVHLVI